jgi:hydrogenase expression/formation protein HypC
MCLAVPGKLIAIEGDQPLTRTGKVDFSGVQKEVSLAYVPECEIGDYVLVHVGFAIERVDEKEAANILESIRQLGAMDEFVEEIQTPASGS